MTIEEYADIIQEDLVIRRYANQNNRYVAQFEHAETTEGTVLIGNYGQGKTPDEAIVDYINGIKGKILIVNAFSETKRREYGVPNTLYWKGEKK